jgi:prepilin-type N-terminal cleavage/methylation domain-containing protein
MNRSGFTLLELVIVVVMMGAVMAIALPTARSVLDKTNVRSARVAFGAQAALARSVAIQRRCTTTLNFTTGAAGKVWVTTCKVSGTGRDTVGTVDPLASRFGVSIGASLSFLQYSPRGVSVGYQGAVVRFTATSGGGAQDSSVINPVGKVVH